MRKSLLTILIILTMGLSLSGTEPNYEELKAELRPRIKKIMRQAGITGLSIALVDGEKMVWAEGFGYADLKRKIPADEMTVYKLASISKTFTAIAIMQLVEQGKIDLDRPLTDYLPDFEIKSRFEDEPSFTIRQMLTHHAGLPNDHFYPCDIPLDAQVKELYSNYGEWLLEQMEETHVVTPPGEMHVYSNIGYSLLALVVERVSGLSYLDYTERYIFNPLEMDASFLPLHLRTDLGRRVALPHKFNRPVEKRLYLSLGGGTVNCDVAGMANYIKMLLAGGNYKGQQVIGEETLERMLILQNGDNTLDQGEQMGLSFFLNEDKLNYAGQFFGHSGGLPNYTSNMIILPEHKLGVIAVCNSNSGKGAAYRASLACIQEALKLKSGLSAPEVNMPKDIPMSREEARSYEGLYAVMNLGPVELKAVGRRLYSHSLALGARLELRLTDRGYFRAVNPPPFLAGGYYKFVTIEGRRLLYYGNEPRIAAGEEYKRLDLAPYWLERLGEYRVVENDETIPAHRELRFNLNYKDGILILSVPQLNRLVLTPLNDEEALVASFGRCSKETVYFEEEDGKVIIRWAGFTLEKVK